MELINSRYKIEKVYCEDSNGTVYVARDLFESNNKLLLKFFDSDNINEKIVNYFIGNFIEISSIRHNNILLNYKFDIVNNIDNKKTRKRLYFYTKEYINNVTLTEVLTKLSVKEKISVIRQLCTIVDYLIFRGKVYEYLAPDNIFIQVNEDNIKVKLRDIANITERKFAGIFNDYDRYFIAPEVNYNEENIDKADIYSAGIMIYTLLTGDIGKYDREKLYNSITFIQDKQHKDEFIDLISEAVQRDKNKRASHLRKIIDFFNKCSDNKYNLNFKEEREKLNFKTKVIGRDKEINNILKIDKKFEKRIYNKRLITLVGEGGIGKTRLLQEIDFRLKIRGKAVYHTLITDKEYGGLKPVIRILRQMLKDCQKDLIYKYGCELVKIIPELGFNHDIKPSPTLSSDREKLRLYDRITNFIIDVIENEPTYIIFDDLHNADLETITLLNYILRNSKNCPLLIIASYDKGRVENKKDMSMYLYSWTSLDEVKEYNLYRLNLHETCELTKNILCISYGPINFSTRILKETGGNPRYIEEIIKNLYTAGELFINENGYWDTDTQNYSDIYIPSSVDQVIRSQINLLEPELLEVAKVISIFNSSVSKETIQKILNMERAKLDDVIEKLVSMKIIDEMVEDWGYTYDFYNRQTKKYFYHNIDKEDRRELHKKVAEFLEEVYEKENKGSMEELIHHFTLSNQMEKAANYAIALAKKMQGLLVSSQSILLWENANRLMKNKVNSNKIEILINLGRLYSEQGSNEKAIDFYNEALSCSNTLNRRDLAISCMNKISEIYYKINDLKESEKYVKEAISIAREINNTNAYLESAKNLNRINLSKGKNNDVIRISKSFLEIARKDEKYNYMAHFYNHLGIVYMFTGTIDAAKDYFEKSIKYFILAGLRNESTLPINNIGVIYSEYFDDLNKAMEYFEKGLEICRKENFIRNEITFLINMGEIYYKKHLHTKALEVMKRAYNLANELGDKTNNLIEIYIILSLIYLDLGDYGKSFKYYKLINETYNKDTVERQTISKYYVFLSYFNYKFGQWDKAIQYSNKAIENSIGLDLKQYLKAYSILVMCKYFKTNKLNKEEINRIRLEYKKSPLNTDRRQVLLRFARGAILADDLDFAMEILDEDKDVAEIYTTDYLDMVREITLAYIKENSIGKLYDILNKVQNGTYNEIKREVHKFIADRYFENKEYFLAAKHYIESLDILYKLVSNIPDSKIKLTYAKVRGIAHINKRLNIIRDILSNKDITEENIKKQINKTSLEEYFDFTELKDLFNHKAIKNTFLNQGKSNDDSFTKLEEVISSFTTNYKKNLDTILQFAIQETFANRGYIFTHKEGLDEISVLAATKENEEISNIDKIIKWVRQRNKGILIKNTIEHENNTNYILLPNNVKAIICVPIFKVKSSLFDHRYERRRENTISNTYDIIGYIYLDTDKIFNRFDKERFKLIKTLSYLAFLNIDNYHLKVTSSIDKLTGTYTRKYFDVLYSELINRAVKRKGSFSLIIADIDKFKNVNDTYGHQKGDEILSNIGKIILNNVRDTDIVARYGGEEFIIILQDTTEAESKMIAEKIRKRIEEEQLIGPNYPLTISLGISVFPKHSEYKEELIEKADQALYHAKELGRNKTIVWNSDISNNTKRLDKLAGIVTGNTVQDQRNVLVMVELTNLLKENMDKNKKIYKVLGRIIETLAANQGTLFIINEKGAVERVYARQRFNNDWIDNPRYNESIIQRVIENKNGEFLIDWDDIGSIDHLTGNPDWQSIIVTPLVNDGKLKGVLHVSVPIKEKEFDYSNYNFVNTLSDIIASII